MRRSVATTILCIVPAFVAGGALLACEDGPNQSYSPASGTMFNNGDVDGSFDPVSQSYDAGYGGRTVLDICPADLKRKRWAKMLNEPMAPPIKFAGLDLSGGPEWVGLKIEDAEKAPDPNTLEGGNCQGANGGQGTCGNNSIEQCGNVVWGDNGEVNFSYNLGTHIIDQLDLRPGYLGILEAKDRAGAHTYDIEIGYPVTKDHNTFQIPWTDTTTLYKTLTELYNAVMFTDAPAAGIYFPADETDCHKGGTCLVIPNDGTGQGYFGVRSMGTYMVFPSAVPQPAASDPKLIYIDYVKFVPSSTLPMTLAFGNVGPYTNGTPPNGTKACNQAIGETWSDYKGTCIQPYTDPMINQINLNKLIGGSNHNLEEITFNVVGINQDFSFTPGNLGNKPVPNGTDMGTYGVAQDNQLPKDGDLSTEWYYDVRAYGVPNNENDNGMDTGDQRASGLIIREYQRLVENAIANITGLLPSAPGDCEFAGAPAYVGAMACQDSTGATHFACPQYPVPKAGHVCTGMEGIAIPGDSAFPTDPGAVSAGNYFLGAGFPSVLKPGDHYAYFTSNTGFTDGEYGYFWDMSLQWVTRVMGRGDVHNLPAEVGDRRFFFKYFGIAMVKYLHAYGRVVDAGGDPTNAATLNPAVVAAEPIDLETLFFDNQFGAQFDKFEYIDLSSIAGYAGNTQTPDPNKPYLSVPWDYEYGTDVKVANQRYTNWYKRMDREEIALYQALSPVKTDPPAAHANYGVNLTNMYGSPVLAGSQFGGYECAAAIYKGGVWTPDPEGQFPNAATDCAKIAAIANGPPAWAADPATGDSLMDLNGQMAAGEKAAGQPAAYQAAYHAATGPVHSLLWQYPAVFGGQTIFSQGHSPIQVCPVGATNCSDPAQATSKTALSIGAAQAVVPSFLNPWSACVQTVPGTKNMSGSCDPTDPAFATPIYAYVPWAPNMPGVGFPIPTNGSSNLQVQTAELDFEGNLETYEVKYVPYRDLKQTACGYGQTCSPGFTCSAEGACIASDNTIEIRALEAHDFLGEVFPCQDPTTGDILHVRMYTSAATVLTWMAAHPGNPENLVSGNPSAQTACNIIVRYSPYDNYPDIITSLTNGVSMNTNQGQGFGRIVDATLFNPLYETITQ